MRHIFEDLRRALELNRKEGKKGFSLVELLIVIAIIAILAAIAIPQYNKYRANAMLSNVQQLVKAIATDATNLATTSAQNPACSSIDRVTVLTLNETHAPPSSGTYSSAQTADDCVGNAKCYLVALKSSDNKTVCDYNTYDAMPGWVEKVKSTLTLTIGGTSIQADGNVTVLSNYRVGDKKFGCIYYPNNDTLRDAGTIGGTQYVCKTF